MQELQELPTFKRKGGISIADIDGKIEMLMDKTEELYKFIQKDPDSPESQLKEEALNVKAQELDFLLELRHEAPKDVVIMTLTQVDDELDLLYDHVEMLKEEVSLAVNKDV